MNDAVQILAISDDRDVFNLILSSLESHGHKAICVSSSQDALEMFEIWGVGRVYCDGRG